MDLLGRLGSVVAAAAAVLVAEGVDMPGTAVGQAVHRAGISQLGIHSFLLPWIDKYVKSR